MSSYYTKTTTLGADQTDPGLPAFRDLFKTDITKVVNGMEEYVRKYYPGLLNFDAIRLIGVTLIDPWSPRIMDFVKTVLDVERSISATLTRDNESIFRDKHHEQHPSVSDADVSVYFRAWNDMMAAGRIPESIAKPWSYVPTTLMQDIGKGVGEFIGAGAKPLADKGLNIPMLVFGAIAVYAGVTVFLPKMLLGKK